MTLITQDGRTIDISREYSPFISGHSKNDKHPATVTLTLFTKSKWDNVPYSERRKYPDYETFPERKIIAEFGVIGTYMTDTGRDKAADMLRAAWQSGATEFTMPQDTFEKSATEVFDDFCEKHGLTLCRINEVGYSKADTARNLRIWQTTDEFEKRNIIICDENGDYSKSFAKWKALRRTA